jgi:hypothetical protein
MVEPSCASGICRLLPPDVQHHFHSCVIDGVFDSGQEGVKTVRFREAVPTDTDVQWVQGAIPCQPPNFLLTAAIRRGCVKTLC